MGARIASTMFGAPNMRVFTSPRLGKEREKNPGKKRKKTLELWRRLFSRLAVQQQADGKERTRLALGKRKKGGPAILPLPVGKPI